MRQRIRGTSYGFWDRRKARLASLIGVVILGGVATSAEDRPEKKGGRRAVAKPSVVPPVQNFKAFSRRPTQNFHHDASEPPYPAFIPNSHATGDDLALQEEIARLLCEKARSYPGREEHFSWLAQNEHYQKWVHRVYGLGGYILQAKSLPDGGWVVRVSVRPCVGALGLAEIEDYILEDYRYQDGVLTLVQTDAAVPKPDKHVLRLH